MSRLGPALVVAVLLLGCRSPAPAEPRGPAAAAWPRAVRLGGEEGGDIRGQDVAAHPSGDLIVAACATGTVDLGGGVVARGRAEVGQALLVARYSPDGAPRWVRWTPARCGDGARLAVDAAGGIFLATRAAADAALVDVAESLPAGAPHDPPAVVVALDGDGRARWIRSVGERYLVYGLAADGRGGAVAGGMRTVTSAWAEGFVTALGPDGAPRWERLLTGEPSLYVSDVTIASTGEIAAAGTYDQSVRAEGLERTGPSSSNLFVALLGADDGAVRRLHAFGAGYVHFGGERIAVEPAPGGDLFVAGTFSGPSGMSWQAELGWSDPFVYDGESGPYYPFALRLDGAGGAVRWSRVWQGVHIFAKVQDLAVAGDTVALSIILNEWDDPPLRIDFGAGTWHNARGSDLVGVLLDAVSGETRRAHRFPGDDELDGGRAAALPSGAVVVTGGYTVALDVGGAVLRAHSETYHPCAGRGSPFLLATPPRRDPCEPETIHTTATFLARLFP